MKTEPREGGPAAQTETNRARLFPFFAFAAVAAWLLLVVWYSYGHLARSPAFDGPTYNFAGDWLFAGWFRFDGGWYYSIARDGYSYAGLEQPSSIAFFPAFPLAIRALTTLLHDYILSGVILGLAFGCAATVAMYRWATLKFDVRVARLAVGLLILFPYAWYLFGAVYADGLFLACVLAAFILLEKNHTILAGIAGALATASRPLAAAVVIGLVAVLIQKRGGLSNRAAFRAADAGVLISVAGIFAWMGYLWARFGDPFLFIKIEGAPGWDQAQGPKTWFKANFLWRIHLLPHQVSDTLSGVSGSAWFETTYTSNLILQAELLLLFLVLTILVFKKLGWGYGLYTAVLLATPLIGTQDFQGTGRYLLSAFPCFAVASSLLIDTPRIRAAVLVTSGLLLTLLASSFGRGYYLA